ncbi:MAG: helix-turn-helix domain-containing protein [Thermoplasmatota archaeon]
MARQDPLDHPLRDLLHRYLVSRPGTYLQELVDAFGLQASSVTWHLRKLQRAGLVRTCRERGLRLWYPTQGGKVARERSEAAAALHGDNARLLLERFAKGERTVAAAARDLDIQYSTALWHARRLRDAGFLAEPDDGGKGLAATPEGLQALDYAIRDVEPEVQRVDDLEARLAELAGRHPDACVARHPKGNAAWFELQGRVIALLSADLGTGRASARAV